MEEIKGIIENLLNKLSVDFDEVNIDTENSSNPRFVIKTTDSGVLIGSEGNNIKALNHIIKQLVLKNSSDKTERINFFVDVNDYQAKNIERIKNRALEQAQKAIVFKRNVEMDPMSAFERMIIHSALADNPQITTESEGEGQFRRLVIKYKG